MNYRIYSNSTPGIIPNKVIVTAVKNENIDDTVAKKEKQKAWQRLKPKVEAKIVYDLKILFLAG